MNLSKLVNLIFSLTILFSISKSEKINSTKPFLRVLTPKYICPNEKEAIIEIQKNSNQKLKFLTSVGFEIPSGFQSQRHTLSVWRSIRELQVVFASNNFSEEISLRNKIVIDVKKVEIFFTYPRFLSKV